MRNKVEDLVSRCDTCQRQKLVGRGHGQLPPREAEMAPWREVAVDCIGPWTASRVKHNSVQGSHHHGHRDQSHGDSLHFENTWLARYPPRPVHPLIYDQGGEFTGYAFQRMLRRHNIHGHCISSKNPQANSVAERMHQVVGNALRTLSTLQPPEGVVDAKQLCDTAIAMQCTPRALRSIVRFIPRQAA